MVDLAKHSWDDFYESYDGKFDEKNMLHITIGSIFEKDIEDLGYKLQVACENWHKPLFGEYKYNEDGKIIIIHSCPDREIFHLDIMDFLEDLSINQEWTIEVALSVM